MILRTKIIEGNIKIDKNYYKEALDKRIKNSISLTLIKSKQVKPVKETEENIRKNIIEYLDVKIKECKNNFIKIKDLYDNYEGKKGRKKIFIEITLEIYKEQFKPKIEIKKKKYKNVLLLKT